MAFPVANVPESAALGEPPLCRQAAPCRDGKGRVRRADRADDLVWQGERRGGGFRLRRAPR